MTTSITFTNELPNYNDKRIEFKSHEFESLIQAIYFHNQKLESHSDKQYRLHFMPFTNGRKRPGIKRLLRKILGNYKQLALPLDFLEPTDEPDPSGHIIRSPDDYIFTLQEIDPLSLSSSYAQTDDEQLTPSVDSPSYSTPISTSLSELHLQPDAFLQADDELSTLKVDHPDDFIPKLRETTASPIQPDSPLSHPLSPSAEPSEQIEAIRALIADRDDEQQSASDQEGDEAFEFIRHPGRPAVPEAELAEPEVGLDFVHLHDPATRTSDLLLAHFMRETADEAPPTLDSAPSYE
ncbi:hypothetical protein [Piscirickettsia salmonis]|uniref:hypothetical protein n=2 Tax=Piscirickettsia salmonis TaxID=1238 RepID=UPI0002D4FAAE|nr:hypothetical protein [Piscirickettsia salmonis]WGZ71106.1 hypothetical protein E3220_05280 [Piscirickettsia salmonis EM-90]APS55807.1 hypothetical protein AVI52_00130 [Piscirickettsia salmonis]ERL61948.1 hypothetical protein K661_01696 [Piscirickettsia salmonis LF-89 = ATCC VR-1361]PEQ17469.1 hypothetical protein X973_01900 [Piscirickettsia salmonis]QGN77195.1 hypothetical protein Psal001_01401 [Piscirickettsia salmonis]